MPCILTAVDIEKDFGKEKILKKINLEIEEGTFTAILGPSGSGKSTLLNILSGLIRPSSGRVLHNGKEIASLPEKSLATWKRNWASNVFQNYLLLNNLTAEENIRIGMSPVKPSLAFDRLVRILDIQSILNKFPAQLSGGQQQRVAIARAVIKSPDLLFCDEATGSLDEANSKKVVALLHELKATFGITILFSTHNQQIAQTAERVLTIKDGMLNKDVCNTNPIDALDMVWE